MQASSCKPQPAKGHFKTQVCQLLSLNVFVYDKEYGVFSITDPNSMYQSIVTSACGI